MASGPSFLGSAIKPSARGLANLQSGRLVDLEKQVRSLPLYDPQSCPDGLIDLSGAVNTLMDDFLEEHGNEFLRKCDAVQDLTTAISDFINRKFSPATPVVADDIYVSNGVSALIDNLTFNICNPGEGVLLFTPTYSMFQLDLCARSGIQLLKVSTNGVRDQYNADCASEVVQRLEEAYEKARSQGIRAKMILLCNPCNPTGRCYSRGTLTAIARFCGKNSIHLVSDEIYAMSGFESSEKDLDSFTSVLNIKDDPKTGVFKENIHCLYGASKDFGLGGLRLGFLITRNQLLWQTCRRVALFAWLTPFSTAYLTTFFNNEDLVDNYLHTYRSRLQENYLTASSILTECGLPFYPSNSGMFFLLNLTKWLVYFDGSDPKEDREIKLTRYLAFNAGFYATPAGECFCLIPGCFRFVYASANREALEVVIRRIKSALKKLEKGKIYPDMVGSRPMIQETSLKVYDTNSDDEFEEDNKKRGSGNLVPRPRHQPKLRSLVNLLSCLRES